MFLNAGVTSYLGDENAGKESDTSSTSNENLVDKNFPIVWQLGLGIKASIAKRIEGKPVQDALVRSHEGYVSGKSLRAAAKRRLAIKMGMLQHGERRRSLGGSFQSLECQLEDLEAMRRAPVEAFVHVKRGFMYEGQVRGETVEANVSRSVVGVLDLSHDPLHKPKDGTAERLLVVTMIQQDGKALLTLEMGEEAWHKAKNPDAPRHTWKGKNTGGDLGGELGLEGRSFDKVERVIVTVKDSQYVSKADIDKVCLCARQYIYYRHCRD